MVRWWVLVHHWVQKLDPVLKLEVNLDLNLELELKLLKNKCI